MNMISTGAFQEGMDSTHADSLVKKLVSAWEKKNSKVGRAGGVSLMALSLAACGGEDNTPFSQADVDSAKSTATTDALTGSDGTVYASVDAAVTSNDTSVSDAATTAALTATDGTVYTDVDAAVTAGSNSTHSAAVTAALTDASGVVHNNVDAAITSNDTDVSATATSAAEASLLAGSGFSTVAALISAYEAATAPEGAITSALTTSRDVVSMSGVSDTVTAVYGTLGATDIVSDASSTDSDSLTAVFDLNSATTFTSVNVETINLDIRSATNTTLDLVNVSGANTVNLYTNYGYNPTALTIDNIESGTTIDIATSILLGASEVVTLLADSDVHTSAATLNMNGDSFTVATQSATTDDIDLLTINSGGTTGNTVTLSANNAFGYAATNANSITITGDQNMTIAMVDTTINTDLINIIDNTTGGTTTLSITEASAAGASNDLSNADVDVISVNGALHASDAFVVASGARMDLDSNWSGSAAVDLAVSTTASSSSITINIDTTNVAGGSNDAHITLSEFNTVNIGNTTAGATVLDGNLAMSVGGIGEEIDLNIDTGTSAGITITGTTAAASGTLDTVTLTGASAFVQTGAMTANTLVSTASHNQTFTAALTADSTIDIAALRTLNIDNGVSGSLTITGGGTVDIESTVGGTGEIINISNTGSGDIQGQVTGALTVDVSTGQTFNLQDGVTGNVVLSGAGNFAVADEVTGTITSTMSGLMNFEEIIGDSDFTLTAAATATDELDVSANITGNMILRGTGNADLDSTNQSGNLTVHDSVAVDVATLLTGNLVADGSGAITVATITGSVSAASASGAITVTGSGGQSGSIVTGGGDDSVTLVSGDGATVVTTNGGNDTIDANGSTTALAISAGDGVDSITGSNATTDELTGGNGTDTFIFLDDDESGFSELITDFSVGSSGDILRFDSSGIDALGNNATSTAAGFVKVDTTDTGTDAFASTSLIVLTGTQYANVAAAVSALNGASGMSGNVAATDAVVTVFADTDGHSYVALLEGDGSNDFAATDGEIVKLSNLTHTDLANMTADNFQFF